MTRGFAIALVGIALAVPAAAGTHHGRNTSISTDDDNVRSCADIRVRYDNREASRAEERLSGPATRGPLPVHLPKNAGAWIRGSQRADWGILACKAAESPGTLAQISVSFNRGELQVRGPENDDWTVFFILDGPRDGDIDAQAQNGPLHFSDLSGHITARVENGPLAFRNCHAKIDARAQNGPISLNGTTGEVSARADNGPISVSGDAGNLRLNTQNGPISVRLSSNSWKDGRLEGHAVNGPLTLHIPDGYRSATLVESSGHSPVRCRASACDFARKNWDDDSRRIEFGAGTPIVTLTTVNGPVSIESTREK